MSKQFIVILISVFMLGAGRSWPAPRITEFLARNYSSPDATGATPDWIEIHNPDENPVSLAGWSLTDDSAAPRKWLFPDQVLAARDTMVVWASGQDQRVPGEPLHTNFKLAAAGGFLALYPPEGPPASIWNPYPRQFSDISYGEGAGNSMGYLMVPTPLSIAHAMALPDYVREPEIDAVGGFRSGPFLVDLTSPTPGAEIRYTLDGEQPSESSPLYTQPLLVETTAILRVRGFLPGWLSSGTATRTFIFPETWKNQPDFPEGFSATWGMYDAVLRSSADYGMNAQVTNDPVYGPLIIPALTTTLPVVCVTGGAEAIFGDDGIHGSLRQTGGEVPVSVEYFNPLDPDDRWQARAALNAHGGAVRNFPKKAFRLDFTGLHGDGPLEYPLFPGAATGNFDQLVLRGGGHDSFTARTRGGNPDLNDLAFHASYLRDQFLRKTEVEAGLISLRGRYVHLCLNGLYWGIYDLHERPNAAFFAARSGGQEEDWDVIHHGPQILDGNDEAWSSLLNLASGGVIDEAAAEAVMAATGDRFIDHMLIRMWAADHDWLGPATMPSSTLGTTGNVAYYNSKNWYAARRSRGAQPGAWNFFTWDAEISMGSHLLHLWLNTQIPEGMDFPKFRELHLDMTAVSSPLTPAAVWDGLRGWPDFQIRVGDRARRLFGPGGLLSPAMASARLESMRAELDLPMVAESARWGTVSGFSVVVIPNGGGLLQKWDNGLLTRDTHWRPETEWLRDTLCVERTPVFLAQLQARQLYPLIPPVDIVPFGGKLDEGETFNLLGGGEPIYYSVNGQDPRDGGAGVLLWPEVAGVLPEGSFTVRTRSRDTVTGEWSALTEAVFNAPREPAPGLLVLSEIHYHPAGASPEEAALGFTDDGQFEFLELTNVSSERLDLRSLRFSSGIEFDFDDAASFTELAPGQRVLVVSDPAAFAKRYGAGHPVAGAFANGTRLSNSGERVLITTASGAVIADVTYSDRSPWPSAADGPGRSLVLVDESSGLTGSTARAWRPGSTPGGSPGAGEAPLTYVAWLNDHFSAEEAGDADMAGALADPDGDGVVNLLEYAMVSDPRNPDGRPTVEAAAVEGKIVFRWERRRGSADIGSGNATLQVSSGNGIWTAAEAAPGIVLTTVSTGEGTDAETVQVDPALSPIRFVRVWVAL